MTSIVRMSRNRQRIKHVIGLLLTPIVFYGLLRLFEYVQVYQPRTELITDPSTIHPAPEEIFFTSGNGYQLNGWFFPSLDQSPWEDWVILVSHGNGGNISYRLKLYELWIQAGFSVFPYDYKGYGLSSGRPSEQGTYEDATNAYEWLIKRGFKPDNIIALGESLGGAVATELATRRPLAGLVLQSTFTGIKDLGKELFPWLPVEMIGSIDYATHSKLPDLNLPLLILHSREDTMIPFHHAEKNFRAGREPKLLRELAGNHNDGLTVSADRYRSHITEFKELLITKKEPTDLD
jgi:fermentation-respiration switch protein FrsA (DUF1100 family)